MLLICDMIGGYNVIEVIISVIHLHGVIGCNTNFAKDVRQEVVQVIVQHDV